MVFLPVMGQTLVSPSEEAALALSAQQFHRFWQRNKIIHGGTVYKTLEVLWFVAPFEIASCSKDWVSSNATSGDANQYSRQWKNRCPFFNAEKL